MWNAEESVFFTTVCWDIKNLYEEGYVITCIAVGATCLNLLPQ